MKFLLIFLECAVFSSSLYMLIQLFSSISVNSGFLDVHPHASHLATIHLDLRK